MRPHPWLRSGIVWVVAALPVATVLAACSSSMSSGAPTTRAPASKNPTDICSSASCVTVPNVLNICMSGSCRRDTEQQAEKILTTHGLRYIVTDVPLGTAAGPIGTIYGEVPDPLEVVPRGSTVNIEVIEPAPRSPVGSVSSPSTLAPRDTPAPASFVSAVTGVPSSIASAVGVPSQSLVVPPTIKQGQPKLTIEGRPGVVFIAGEFCPFCAAERWPIIMAFGKFGSFSNLKETTSSPWDTDPDTATFSFYGASYSSPYLTFDTSEHESNDSNGIGTRKLLQPLTPLESSLWKRYDSPDGYPFLDIGNEAFVLTPSYNPAVLSGLDQSDIVSRFSNPNDPVTESIVGTANYLTASICAITGEHPESVCSASVVAEAAKAMHLS